MAGRPRKGQEQRKAGMQIGNPGDMTLAKPRIFSSESAAENAAKKRITELMTIEKKYNQKAYDALASVIVAIDSGDWRHSPSMTVWNVELGWSRVEIRMWKVGT